MRGDVVTTPTPEATAADRPALVWSPARVWSGLVMAGWAGLFWFVLFAGRTGLYLSTRTAWVVPLGACLATTAAVLRLASARAPRAERLTVRESWMLGVVALPVVILLAMPPATLGTYAAGRRSGFVGSGVSASAGSLDSGTITLIDVAAAQSSKEGQAALARHAGEPVIFEGLVTNEAGAGPGEFLLTRFIITCCVADATIAQVKVVDAPPGQLADNQWVQVTGKIYPLGSDVLIDASSVVPIDQPQHPYLTP
jgi:putative membrane protein